MFDKLRPPKENLLRATEPSQQLRAGAGADSPVLFGHFAVFNRWTEIDSMWEGNFLERIAPGAFKKTFREQRDQLRILLNHGYDPELGDRPIAEITDLREDSEGAYYEANLLDGVPELVVAGLRRDQYGASFRFTVMIEQWVEDPGASDDNPRGLPERTIKEAAVREFGPVTWGAYPEATAGLRWSPTDEYLVERMTQEPRRLGGLLEFLAHRDRERSRSAQTAAATTTDTAETAAAADGAQPPEDATATEPKRTEQDSTTQEPAPSPDSAEVGPHAEPQGRTKAPQPLYGTSRKETSKPWLL